MFFYGHKHFSTIGTIIPFYIQLLAFILKNMKQSNRKRNSSLSKKKTVNSPSSKGSINTRIIKDFKTALINMLKNIVEKVDGVHEPKKNCSRERNDQKAINGNVRI